MTEHELLRLLIDSSEKFIKPKGNKVPFSVQNELNEMEKYTKKVYIDIDVNEIYEYRLLKFTHSYKEEMLNAWLHEILYKIIYPKLERGWTYIFLYDRFIDPTSDNDGEDSVPSYTSRYEVKR